MYCNIIPMAAPMSDKKAKKKSKGEKSEESGNTDFMIQPESSTPKLDTSKYDMLIFDTFI